ncbi:MAG: 2Fe-2S iron-sulfur cluster binding domain-containing protein [Sphingomonadales bacterium]|nr:2Fe-2S iron-sulfur cluster binding domain-containing protein [Sphingomonadales bacterium]
MAKIFVTGADGVERAIEAEDGGNLMEALRDNGFEELAALCGGCCACATCHIYVDPDWMAQVGTPTGDEDDLLDSSDARAANSRLSCQIPVGPEIEGMRVTIAPMD